MRTISTLIAGVSAAALLPAIPAVAQTPQTPGAQSAQEAGGAPPPPADEIVVTGIRESIASAQAVKRRAPQVVDAVVAEDIGKLPDLNTAQTAGRIPGIQIYRVGGEASNVLVRGLPFFTTTYNGREIFTAETRVVALQDFPSSNIAALEAIKTQTADLVSPGIAGIVNVRSRKPFDFQDGQVSGTVWGLYTRQGKRVKPNFNVLATKRWDTGAGEFGILVQGSYQDMRYLDAEISNTDFEATNSTFNGQNIRFPDIQRLYYRSGTRGRPSANVQLQWKPNPDTEIYAEGLYQGFINKIDDRRIDIPLYVGTFSDVQFRPGTNLVERGTVAGSPGRIFSFQGATFNRTDTFQIAGGARFGLNSPFKLNIDVARTLSTFRGNTESVDRVYNGTPTVNFDSSRPSFAVSGVNFTDPANQTFQGLYEENQRSAGRDWQARADAQYDFDHPVFKNIQFGARYQTRNAQRNFDNRYVNNIGGPGSTLLPLNIPATQLPLTFAVYNGVNIQPTYTWSAPTYDSVYSNITALRQFVAAQCAKIGIAPGQTRDCASYIATNGGPIPAAPVYTARERRIEGYGQINFGSGDVFSGILGLRVQNSRLTIPNAQAGNGTVTIRREDTQWLPNASVNFRFDPKLQVRLAVARTVTRPEFSQLGPVTFGPPPGGGLGTANNPATAGGGNPFLLPFTSWNYDASLEYYFSRAGYASLAVFRRTLNRFIINQTSRFTDPTLGVVSLTGPINAGRGRINGAEAQFTSFFDFGGLPAWLKSFGMQANVTYVDFKLQQQSDFATTANNLTFPVAYQAFADQQNGVSKWNFNLVGLFEQGPVSARLTYNARSSFAATRQFRTATIANNVVVPDDLYTETGKPADRLDLSLQLRLAENAGLFFDWTNITRAPFRQGLSSARAGAPRADFVRYLRYDESTISLGFRFNLGK